VTVDDVVRTLEQAKRKLAEAKATGLRGASVLAKARDLTAHVLGHAGRNSPLVAQMTVKHKAVLDQVMSIDALSQRIDQAIAQARSIGDTGNAASDTGSTETPP
jgi:hypothetical protein